MRRAQEMPQRRLVYELRMAIDRAVRTDRWGAVDDLVAAHPSNTWSSHVQHNIGARRRVWLESRARRASAMSPRRTAR